jgi:hypothetical protein
MQIDFTPKKLKEAKEYVNLLKNPKVKKSESLNRSQEESTFKRILRFLFK